MFTDWIQKDYQQKGPDFQFKSHCGKSKEAFVPLYHSVTR